MLKRVSGPGGGHWFTPVIVRLVLLLLVFMMFLVGAEGLLNSVLTIRDLTIMRKL